MALRPQSNLFDHLGLPELDRSDVPGAAGWTSPETREVVDAVRKNPTDPALLRDAAARLAAAGLPAYAIDCYLRMRQLGALTDEDRSNLAGLLLAQGAAVDAAELVLERPGALTPAQAGLAAHAMAVAGAYRPALGLLLRRPHRNMSESGYVLTLANLLGQVRRHGWALNLARHYRSRFGPDRSVDMLIASQLGAMGRYAQARDVLANLTDKQPHERALASSIASAMGDHEDALGQIDEAIAKDPENPAFLLARANSLWALKRSDAAADAVLLAERLDSGNEPLARTAFAMATETGRYKDALRIGALLTSRNVDDRDLAATLRVILERLDRQRILSRVRGSDGDYPAHAPPVAPVRISGAGRPLSSLIRIISALILRETRTRFGRSRYGYLWVIFEPLAHIGIMIGLITLLSHSRSPPMGPNFAIFYFTGIIPYHLFTHTISHLINSAPENRPLLQLPPVKLFDVFLARGILELVTEMVVAAILLLVFAFLGLFALPHNPGGIALSVLLLWVTAYGLGMAIAVLNAFFTGTERIWGAVSSILYFSSGTFYVPRMMPEWIRNVLVWNPVLQGIELVRSSFFVTPDPFWLDQRYMVGCAAGALAIGLTSQRLFHRKLLQIE